MKQTISIRKIWLESFDIIFKRPIIILPFIIIAFLEGLSLELIYFSSRKPLAHIFNPIIKHRFGEIALHYPGNLAILPKLFYYAQLVIYVFIGVFLAAISINMLKNIKMNLPIKAGELIKDAAKRYPSFFSFGIIIAISIFILRKVDRYVFSMFMNFVSRYIPQIMAKLSFIGQVFFLFLSNIILWTFLILALPLMIIHKKSLSKALGGSIYMGFRDFLKIFALIFLPFLVFLPVTLLKSGSFQLAVKTFPEIHLYITAVEIIASIFIDCFLVVCASKFLLDKES